MSPKKMPAKRKSSSLKVLNSRKKSKSLNISSQFYNLNDKPNSAQLLTQKSNQISIKSNDKTTDLNNKINLNQLLDQEKSEENKLSSKNEKDLNFKQNKILLRDQIGTFESTNTSNRLENFMNKFKDELINQLNVSIKEQLNNYDLNIKKELNEIKSQLNNHQAIKENNKSPTKLVHLFNGSASLITVRRKELAESKNVKNHQKLASVLLTALASVKDLYKSTLTGRGSTKEIKKRKVFPLVIVEDIKKMCKLNFNLDQTPNWEEEVENTIRRKLGIFKRFFDGLRRKKRLSERDLEREIENYNVVKTDLIDFKGFDKMVKCPETFFDELDKELFECIYLSNDDSRNNSSDGNNSQENNSKSGEEEDELLNNLIIDDSEDELKSYLNMDDKDKNNIMSSSEEEVSDEESELSRRSNKSEI